MNLTILVEAHAQYLPVNVIMPKRDDDGDDKGTIAQRERMRIHGPPYPISYSIALTCPGADVGRWQPAEVIVRDRGKSDP
jgi:hypothetical protein